MKYMLVLQFSEDAISFDELVELEDALTEGLEELAEVDGHDIGAGEANIFIISDDVASTFDEAQQVLKDKGKSLLKAAWREVEFEEYRVLFPPGVSDFTIA